MPIALSMAESVIPDAIWQLFIAGLNKRLGVDCDDMTCVANNSAL